MFEIDEEKRVLLKQVIGRCIPYHGKLYDFDGNPYDPNDYEGRDNPNDYKGQYYDDEWVAEQILVSSLSHTGTFYFWNEEAEEAKLDDLLRTARKLLDTFNSLHLKIRCEVTNFSKEAETVENYNSGDLPDLTIITALPELIERSIKSWRAAPSYFLRGGILTPGVFPPGRTNWLGIYLILTCRAIWFQRTGKAHKSLNPASRFGKFAQEVFDVVGIKEEPRSAMNAWRREVHS